MREPIAEVRKTVSVFPRRPGDGAYRSSYSELKYRGALQSKYYETLLPSLLLVYQQITSEPAARLLPLIRPVLVTLTSLLVDRSIRVAYRLAQYRAENMRVLEVLPYEQFSRLDHLRNLTSQSWHFNQALVQKIASVLGAGSERLIEPNAYPEYPGRPGQKNLLAGPPPSDGLGKLVNRIKNRLLFSWRHMPSLSSRYASLGFSGDDYYLSLRGFYGPFGKFEYEDSFEWASAQRDNKLREYLTIGLKDVFPKATGDLLVELGNGVLSNVQCRQLGQAFPEFFATYCPLNFLEALKPNLLAAARVRNVHKRPLLIGTDLVTDEGHFLAAITKDLGGDVIGMQHGGHYGYIEGMSLNAEFEYSLYDKMITWGWSQFDSELPSTVALPLPSPRLSEASVDVAHVMLNSVGKNRLPGQVLLMTNHLPRFPHISTCGQSRIDFIDEIVASSKELVSAMAAAKISVDHKPYSQTSVDFLEKYYSDLAEIGGAYYRLTVSKQKGISPSLLKDYRAVLWDQIGTGTLDCFVSGIPTMIHWRRIYSRESVEARQLVAELESVGVVHSSSDSLVREMSHLLADPRAWMQDEHRQAAIARFCNKFARTDRRWPAIWRQALRALDERSVNQSVLAKAGK